VEQFGVAIGGIAERPVWRRHFGKLADSYVSEAGVGPENWLDVP